jgi:prepilin-type N-terminal cleavage/methylation domain-containing protein
MKGYTLIELLMAIVVVIALGATALCIFGCNKVYATPEECAQISAPKNETDQAIAMALTWDKYNKAGKLGWRDMLTCPKE